MLRPIIFVWVVFTLVDATKSSVLNQTKSIDPYDTVKIVSSYKYPITEYSVKTDDGYILKIHRIQCRTNSLRNHKSVLIMSDLWSSSVFWVMSGPKYSLAFYLADLGYDVWLGNNRGSKYGQDGKVLKPKDPAFWQFSVHEFGKYDLPAIIDYILNKVNCHQIYFIGWGYGATQFFVMASVKPCYVKKVKNMQALGPSVFLKNIRSNLVKAIADLDRESIYEIAGRDAAITTKKFLQLGGQKKCLKIAKNKKTCNYVESLTLESFDTDIPGYPEVLDYPLVQISTRFVLYVQQQIKHGFRQFDNGELSNLYFYCTKDPPKYNISAADLPIALYYSDGNVISTTKDVLRLAKKLPNVKLIKIEDDKFGHIDYPMTKNGHHLYFHSVKEILESHY